MIGLSSSTGKDLANFLCLLSNLGQLQPPLQRVADQYRMVLRSKERNGKQAVQHSPGFTHVSSGQLALKVLPGAAKFPPGLRNVGVGHHSRHKSLLTRIALFLSCFTAHSMAAICPRALPISACRAPLEFPVLTLCGDIAFSDDAGAGAAKAVWIVAGDPRWANGSRTMKA